MTGFAPAGPGHAGAVLHLDGRCVGAENRRRCSVDGLGRGPEVRHQGVADEPPLNELLRGDRPGDDLGVGVPPEDGPALAAAVGALLEDDARRRALGEAGRRAVAARYTPDAMGAAYARLYRELLR